MNTIKYTYKELTGDKIHTLNIKDICLLILWDDLRLKVLMNNMKH